MSRAIQSIRGAVIASQTRANTTSTARLILSALSPEHFADGSPLQPVEGLRQGFKGMGAALFQPPLQESDLCSRDIERQKIQWQADICFRKRGSYVRFNILRPPVAHAP